MIIKQWYIHTFTYQINEIETFQILGFLVFFSIFSMECPPNYAFVLNMVCIIHTQTPTCPKFLTYISYLFNPHIEVLKFLKIVYCRWQRPTTNLIYFYILFYSITWKTSKPRLQWINFLLWKSSCFYITYFNKI